MDMNDQAKSLRKQLDRDKKAKTISIVSGKGGVGKTNFAINFSLKLLASGKNVLLIDMDIGMGNIDILLGKMSTYSLVDIFNHSLSFHDIIEVGPKGLPYIAGGNSFEELIVFSEDHLNYFHDQFERIQSEYDFIIFDLGAGASKTSMSFVLASDETFIMMNPEPPAITDAYSMIKYIIVQQENLPISLILNRVKDINEGIETINRFSRLVKNFLGVKVTTLGLLPEDKIVSESVIKQVPFILLKDNTPISKSLDLIIKKYLYKQNTESFEIPTRSFMNRLRKFLSF